ncbi:MAG TPA: DNA repair protein RecO [Brumimicrobium sp.]|nr:DNA repair protein RecO [Brumimicrobium sp.]
MKGIQSGILLKKLNYSETSLILHFFTLEDGFQAYIFQGGKKKKGNTLQALSIVEITAYRRTDSDLGKITEINSLFVPQTIPYDPLKSSLAFFMTEVLAQVLQKSDRDSEMYSFLVHEIQWLDHSEELTNYLIWFMIKFAEQMGVGINVEDEGGRIFNLQEGVISNQTPHNDFYISDELVPIFIQLLNSDKSEFLALPIKKTHRKQLLEHLLKYFYFHFSGFKTPQSLKVIQTVMD